MPHRLTLDLWLAKDNRFLNPKSSYKRILMAPSCRFIPDSYGGQFPEVEVSPEIEVVDGIGDRLGPQR